MLNQVAQVIHDNTDFAITGRRYLCLNQKCWGRKQEHSIYSKQFNCHNYDQHHHRFTALRFFNMLNWSTKLKTNKHTCRLGHQVMQHNQTFLLTAESHFKADSETWLHDLADRFVWQNRSSWGQQKRSQHLYTTIVKHCCIYLPIHKQTLIYKASESCITKMLKYLNAAVRIFPNKTTTTLHLFNCLFSRTTWVSQYQKGKTSLHLNDARDDRV